MCLEKISKKPSRLIVGLMSGTSADGVDACLCQLQGYGKDTKVTLRHTTSLDYPPEIRTLLLQKIGHLSLEEIARLNFLIADIFAQAALKCIQEAGYRPIDIDAISSHGQTLIHLPNTDNPVLPVAATLQVGDISVIAQKTRILTLGDFRPADMAQGGQGAPLVPFADYVLFSHPAFGRIIQNIGGIANLTYLPPGCSLDDVMAFDTGPGNMVVDALVTMITGGKQTMDRDGDMAFKGRPNQALLQYLMENPYFDKPPPKSTGREMFGIQYARDILEKYPTMKNEYYDLLATVSELTVLSIVESYEKWVFPKGPVHEVIVGGGGAKNKYFVTRLKEELANRGHNIEVLIHDDLGIPAKAKEPIAFAILGNELIGGNPNNVPRATGARRPVVMGKVAFP